MTALEQLDRCERRLRTTLEVMSRRGATIHPTERSDPPEPEKLDAAFKQLGGSVPAALVAILEAGTLSGGWQLREEDEATLPEASSEVSWGGLDLSLNEVISAEESRRGWVKECFPNRSDPYDIVWHDKFAFHTVRNGDCLAVGVLPDDPSVYYLSHDDGEGHGAPLAPSLEQLLEKWSQIGFAGPEDWLLLPFMHATGPGIDEQSATAREWRAALSLDQLSAV